MTKSEHCSFLCFTTQSPHCHLKQIQETLTAENREKQGNLLSMETVNDSLPEGPLFPLKTGQFIHPHFFAHFPGCYGLRWRKTVLQGDMVYLR